MATILERSISWRPACPKQKRVETAPASVPVERVPKTAVQDVATSASRRFLIVIAAMIGAVLEVLDTSITNVAVPQMMGNLGATLAEIGWVSTGYIISNVIVLPMTGWLADRFGRRRYFAASIVLFTIASLFCGLSSSLSGLVFWRIVQGLGGGGLLATGQVIMLDAFPKSQQGVATAIFGMGVMIGPSLGPVVGGYLTDNLSWPWIFFINLPFGIAAAIMTMLFVPNQESHAAKSTEKRPGVDIVGIGLLAAGMGALQTVLERGQQEDWFSSNLIIVLTIIAVVGLISFVIWELRVPNPIVDLRVLKHRSLAIGSIFGVILGLGLYATLFLLPVYLQNSQGYTAFETGMILLPSALISMLSFMMAGPLTQKYDARVLLALGAGMMAFGSFGLSHLTTQSGGDHLLWPLLWRGMAMGFLFIPLTVASLAGLKPQELGIGSGMINLARQLGGSIGIAAFSTVLSRRSEFHQQSVSAHLTDANPTVHAWLLGAQSQFQAHGADFATAKAGALSQLALVAQKQSLMLSFDDCFLAIAAAFLLALPLVIFLEKSDSNVDMGAVH